MKYLVKNIIIQKQYDLRYGLYYVYKNGVVR